MITLVTAIVHYHEMIWMRTYCKEENFYYLLFNMYTKEQQIMVDINKAEEIFISMFAVMKADIKAGRNVELIESVMPTIKKMCDCSFIYYFIPWKD